MPNPLMRAGRTNTSHGNTAVYPDSITEHPEPATPIAETYAGDNNPYRGTEQHGVEDNNEPHPTPGYTTRNVPVRTDPPPPNYDPIPVRIVEEGGREIRSMRTVVMFAPNSGNAALILGRDENRTFARFKNPDEAQVIYINHNPHTVDSAAMNGFPVGPGEHYETQTQEEVYASAPGGSEANYVVPMIIEFSIPVGAPKNATFR